MSFEKRTKAGKGQTWLSPVLNKYDGKKKKKTSQRDQEGILLFSPLIIRGLVHVGVKFRRVCEMMNIKK